VSKRCVIQARATEGELQMAKAVAMRYNTTVGNVIKMLLRQEYAKEFTQAKPAR
jgi:antitoxin component of RelBE/YafQ-DinJ toxin-antitoxin module